MFTDMKEALEAEALELTPTSSSQSAAASLVVAHQARDMDDLADLLGALGLPCGEDDLVRLLPHLSAPDNPTSGDTMPANAFTATAASMLNSGDSPEHVRETLGLSESELTEALQYTDQNSPTPDTDTDAPEAAEPVPDSPADSDGTEALLSWAKNHPAAVIRRLKGRAARSAQRARPVRRHPPRGTRCRLVLGVAQRGSEVRAGLVQLGRVEVPEPGLAGFETADDGMAGALRMRRGVLGGRVVATADVPALRTAAQMEPPAAGGVAVPAPRTARRDTRIDSGGQAHEDSSGVSVSATVRGRRTWKRVSPGTDST